MTQVQNIFLYGIFAVAQGSELDKNVATKNRVLRQKLKETTEKFYY